jgi:deoxycytidylate deaminase
MERDEKQDEDYGQHFIDTLQHADFFINNDHPNIESIKIDRFLDLILGVKIESPTKDEFAMYIAQSAALRSGCLSRQIGAAIINDEGEIISTGHNDVPKRGGLCSSDDGDNDFRCINIGNECRSHKYKGKIRDKIAEILNRELGVKEQAEKIADKIASETRIKDLIEFSRAVHAEMEAIMSAARKGVSPKGATLYCTTFPCHNCARHILAAGIKKVYFIEPYGKSLALQLHGESIKLDASMATDSQDEAVLSHFEGVAPRQYLNLFKARGERKSGGKGINVKPSDSMPVLPEYLDSWIDVEAKVVEDLKNRLEKI